MKKRMSHMRLPHDETDMRKRYTLPDPDVLGDSVTIAHRYLYYGEREPTKVEWQNVVALAEAYFFLTTYTLGQEHCVEKLRHVWRARRALDAQEVTDS
jgi:hypothetical protein